MQTSEEIELDIDSLPPHVLMRLYKFVIRPSKPRVGRSPNGSGLSKRGSSVFTGTKRRRLDEEEESAKIKQLEENLARLKNVTAGGVVTDNIDSEIETTDYDHPPSLSSWP